MDATDAGDIRVRSRRYAWGAAVVLAATGFCSTPRAEVAPAAPLADLSLEELSQVQVTSVSKTTEALASAPAAIFVISHDDILRSGVTSISEALRLAPNLQITQYSATNYIAGARGFAGAQDDQNFSNKLLVLIDGRSVYSPLYSGVYLDVQDVLMEDIDRIEVISGPGATLWGANAMNGVINIITRPSYLTEQSLVKVGYSNLERTVSGRYAGKLGDAFTYRVYGKTFERGAEELEDHSSAQDSWNKTQGGFRTDWNGAADSVTTQGDLYRGYDSQADAPDVRVEGGNLLSRWNHPTANGNWQLQGYYDFTERGEPNNGSAFALRTFDVEAQDQSVWGRHHVVFGTGARLNDYRITNSDTLLFEPPHRSLFLGDVFLQDAIALSTAVDLTLGMKFEHDAFSGWAPLPDARLAWRIDDANLLWGSVARAIRSPTPFDHDVVEKFGDTDYLNGNDNFKPEAVDAFEIGYRTQALSDLSLSVSSFYNRYDDLRTIEPSSSANGLPLAWGNLMKGHTYGLETWAKWQVASWWRLSPGLRLLRKDLEFEAGASQLLGTAQSGNDPNNQALLTSSMDFSERLNLESTLRRVGALPDPHLAGYTELNSSLNYRAWQALDVSLSGFNLLHSRHLEYPDPDGEYIRRSVLAQARWRF